MDMTTTERNWLSQFTTKTKEIYLDVLKIRRRDYDGVIPPEVEELRKLKEKVSEHDSLLGGLFRQLTTSFSGLIRLDDKLKKKK